MPNTMCVGVINLMKPKVNNTETMPYPNSMKTQHWVGVWNINAQYNVCGGYKFDETKS